MNVLIGYVFALIINAVVLWLAMKLFKINGKFLDALLISAICVIVETIPYAGIVVSAIVMYFLVKWRTAATLWKNIGTVLITKLIAMGIIILISS